MRRLLTTVSFLLLLKTTNALYFFLRETEKKCFIEEVPKNTLVTCSYNLLLFDDNSKIYLPANRYGVQVVVTDPEGSITLSRVYASEGRFTFTSHLPGEHVICISSNSSAWYGGSQMKIHLHIALGQHDYSDLTKKEKIPELQLRVKQLIDQMEMIRKEQVYQRFREERFRATSDSTNLLVWLCAIVQCLLLLTIGFGQMRHLRSFFLAKKLI